MQLFRRYPILVALLVSGLLIVLFGAGVFALINFQQDDTTTTPTDSSLSADFPAYAADLNLSLFPEPIALTSAPLPATHATQVDVQQIDSPVTLVYFGYTSCPDACPNTLGTIVRAYRELDDAARQQVTTIMVTVDPERDTLERLTRYLAGFDETFIGLRAESNPDQTALTEQFFVTAVPHEVESELGYLVDHTTSLFLVDHAGRVLGRYAYETPYSAIADDIRTILDAEGA